MQQTFDIPTMRVDINLHATKRTVIGTTLLVMATVTAAKVGVALAAPHIRKATDALKTEAAKWSPPTN
jgi:hypothetical protein